MKEFLKKKGSIIITAAIVLSILLGVTAQSLSGTSFASGAVNAVMRPIGSGVAVLADFFEGIYGYMFRFDRLKTENEQLKTRVADLEKQVRDSTAADDENGRLRELLKLKEKHSDFDLETTKIISWGASNWTSTFSINKGSNSGIELFDCIITANGYLVGQIIEVGPNTALARTVIDPNMNAGALIDRTGLAAVACGYFEYMTKGNLKLTFIPNGATIVNGDVITTSGKGQSIPKGLAIGKVVDAGFEASGQAQYAVVQPMAEISKLSQVFVIKGFNVED